MKKNKYIIGADEVGRGPLAGSVTVCAVAIKNSLRLRNKKQLPKLNDSKKLSKKQREEWMRWVKEMEKKGKITYVIANVSPKVIDRINISKAVNLATTRALIRLYKKKPQIKGSRVFLDGGIFPDEKKLFAFNFKLSTIVHGDELISIVSLASIIAKVTRDKKMIRLSKKYNGYALHKNKGYGTSEHKKSVRKKGVSDIHRLTFIH